MKEEKYAKLDVLIVHYDQYKLVTFETVASVTISTLRHNTPLMGVLVLIINLSILSLGGVNEDAPLGAASEFTIPIPNCSIKRINTMCISTLSPKGE